MPRCFVTERETRYRGLYLDVLCKEVTNGTQGSQEQNPSPLKATRSLVQLWESLRHLAKFNDSALTAGVFKVYDEVFLL